MDTGQLTTASWAPPARDDRNRQGQASREGRGGLEAGLTLTSGLATAWGPTLASGRGAEQRSLPGDAERDTEGGGAGLKGPSQAQASILPLGPVGFKAKAGEPRLPRGAGGCTGALGKLWADGPGWLLTSISPCGWTRCSGSEPQRPAWVRAEVSSG